MSSPELNPRTLHLEARRSSPGPLRTTRLVSAADGLGGHSTRLVNVVVEASKKTSVYVIDSGMAHFYSWI